MTLIACGHVRCTHDKIVPIHELKAHPKNRNIHPPDQIEQLAEILKYQGWRYPVKVSKQSGYVTAGHGRMAAALHAGWTHVPVNYQDYDNDDMEYADVQADNAIASWAELELKLIALDIKERPNLDVKLLGIKGFGRDKSVSGGDPEETPELPKEAKTKRGELWVLGKHRLLIDDCTVKENVDRLMGVEKADMVFTDPPYGMNLDTNYDEMYAFGDHTHTGNRFKKIEGDAESYDPAPILMLEAKRKFVWGCDYFYGRLPPGGSIIAWDKRTESLDRVPGNTTEFCWALPPTRRTSARILWSGHYGMNGDDSGKRMHPTQKPIKLVEWFFEQWGKDTVTVLDVYLGSGSTLIACEKTNRRCFGMEIEPLYGDVILSRWSKYTGLDPVRDDGVTWSSLNPAL
jgi:DNA modification methylase